MSGRDRIRTCKGFEARTGSGRVQSPVLPPFRNGPVGIEPTSQVLQTCTYPLGHGPKSTRGEIRTLTAQFLKLTTPAVGLPGQSGS